VGCSPPPVTRGGPAAARWLRTHATGTRAQMSAALTSVAASNTMVGKRSLALVNGTVVAHLTGCLL
jgi:hypothetical protein